ncbi:unnamed protein product [Parnassius mnemosyne]|uniref:SWIM-type domain-containing protein n=1 Tax=Parnassius mnemosyne TaxID=213953 RepID=A0AAV1M7F5_9NEOP
MSDRDRVTRIMCINCNICVNTLRRYRALELNIRVTTLLCSWVYPQIITEDDYVCEACRDLAMISVNHSLQEISGIDDQQPGPSHRGHVSVCLLCGCSILQRQSDRILRDNPTDLHQLMYTLIENRVAPRQVTETDKVCHPCWLRTQREARRTHDVNRPQSAIEEPSTADEPILAGVQSCISNEEVRHAPNGLTLPDYRRAANNNNRCVFKDCNSTTLHGISDKLRAVVLSNHNYYIPKLARVCSEHLSSNLWETLYYSANSLDTFTADQVQHVFSFIKINTTLDFENIFEMDDRVFEYWIGLTKEKFNSILEEVPRINETRKGCLGLAALLMKMRTGDSDERIATLVQVPRRTLENAIDKIREILLQDFVLQNLGIYQLSREQLLEHKLTIPHGIFGNENNTNGIVICDGTYIYINKSSNYMFQKQSYSLHKYRNLLKPFMIVACDGYIVDCFGPYKATTSDAEIMTNLFSEGSALRSYFRENDIFILDRGFRDSISFLEGCGYKPYMPESLIEGEHQLTTAQANRSRCVTICRWVVEAVNGHFKRDFKLFRQEYFHRSLPHMMQNFQIAAALLNRFGVRFVDNIYATEILEIIRQRMNLENNLANMVEARNMNRRTSYFQSITADRNNIVYFPILEMRDLILFALGMYQIRQARSYYGEHVRFHGGYRIEVCSEQFHSSEYDLRGSANGTTLIRGRIKSRHVTRRQYYVYILLENNIPGRTGITEYCCSCLVGRRTVGCCAHVMTLVWYLGWARHQQHISAPAEFLDGVIVREDDEE